MTSQLIDECTKQAEVLTVQRQKVVSMAQTWFTGERVLKQKTDALNRRAKAVKGRRTRCVVNSMASINSQIDLDIILSEHDLSCMGALEV